MTQNILNNRTAIKFNSIIISDKDNYVSKDTEQGLIFGTNKVKAMIQNKEFENFVNVSIDSENDSVGPNQKPSRKGIKRLLSIIKDTNYKIVSQQGQVFVLEGVN